MRDAWGAGKSPADLFALTPHQFLFLHFAPRPDPDPDELSEMARVNAERAAAGLRPEIPSWWLPRLRRV